jgi:flagellar motor switch/type III secretory pathway protein FliN
MKREVLPYPWTALAVIPREAIRRARAVREALGEALDPATLAAGLASLLDVGAKISVRRVAPSSSPPSPDRSIHLATPSSSVHFSIAPDAALASALLAKILERPSRLVDPAAPLTPPLRGALAAIALEAARRTPGAPELVALRDAPATTHGIMVEVTLLLDERPYGLSAWAAPGTVPTGAPTRVPSIADLGDLPLSVPLVAAASTALFGETSDLSVGDVWLPGKGWYCASAGAGVRSLLCRAVLAPPSSESGVEVGHSEDGETVLLGSLVALAAEGSDPRYGDGNRNMSEQKNTLDALLLDSPVVVRVEVGTLSLTARQWAALRPGDVLETGIRIAEPVVLRIAGREVARGELVNVDGELGVKISELIVSGSSS